MPSLQSSLSLANYPSIQIKREHSTETRAIMSVNKETLSQDVLQHTCHVEVDGANFTQVSESEGRVLFPEENGVFYNPVQEFNRDISISILRLFALEFKKVDEKTKKQKRREEYRRSLIKSGSEERVPDLALDPTVLFASVLPCTTPNLPDQAPTNGAHCALHGDSVPGQGNLADAASPAGIDGQPDAVLSTAGPAAGIRHEDGLRILEALAASGLRSIRYAKEVGGIREIIANDLSKKAVECMERNIKYNNVGHLIKATEGDASLLLYQNRLQGAGEQFDVVDLDPYGSPHLFLDGAVQAVSEGGLLLVTCTDMAVLCGNSPETSYAKYGATSLKTKACHEMALRIALQCIESHANRYGRYIEPLVSISADFYIRVAVRVFSSPQKVKESYTKVGLVYHCVGCDTITTQVVGNIEREGRSVRHRLPRAPSVGECCTHCNSRHQLAGPIWLAPIHSQQFLKQLLEQIEDDRSKGINRLGTERRISGMLQMMLEELPEVPLYYVHDKLCSVVGTTPGKLQRFKSALLNAGYRVSSSHCHKTSIKTNAPAHVVWDVVRAHELTLPASRMRLTDGAPGQYILSAPSVTKVDFTPHPSANPESRQNQLLRFQTNPTKFWGPSTRSTSRVLGQQQQTKKLRNQGRHAHKKNTGDGAQEGGPGSEGDDAELENGRIEEDKTCETENPRKRVKKT